MAFMDDIIVYSKGIKEHIEHLKWFFELLKQHGLFLKLSKCALLQKEVEFCGHVVGVDGLRLADDKVKAMQARPIMRGPANVRAYLGSCVWFASFIPDYARIVVPLTTLTRKGVTWE
jgi:hypothetical protein